MALIHELSADGEQRHRADDPPQSANAIDIDVADFPDVVADRERWSIDIPLRADRARCSPALER
jgi:hypothetical protein